MTLPVNDEPITAETNRERLFEMIDEVHKRNKGVPVEVIQAEVDAAIAEVREQASRKPRPQSPLNAGSGACP